MLVRWRWWAYPLAALFALGVIGALVFGFAALVTIRALPSLESLTDYRPKVPLRVYSAEGILIGEFGEERRQVVKIDSVPLRLKQAILAAEDDRFYQHGGVDYTGILRAAYSNFTSGGLRQGASTITMQVARNFFLTKEKTLNRKFSEALLAFKIEHSLSKDQILELYFNQIYLGQRSYGFAAAAQVYFGKSLNRINLAEAAMLAGLPKAPSRFNPVVNPQRARARQVYVLRRMRDLGYISNEEFEQAEKQPMQIIRRESQEYALRADYVAEMARQAMYQRYHEDAYTRGYKVYTTIRFLDQEAAYNAVRQGVLDYDDRHGYRGPEAVIKLSAGDLKREEILEEALQEVTDSDGILAAVALEANPKRVKAYRKGGEIIEIKGDGLKFAQKYLTAKPAANQQVIRPGSLIRVHKNDKGAWEITQLPQVEASLVALNPHDGAIRAMVGGFDFNRSQFNHVTQAWRQPGSSFKPFIYSASLEKGFTPATVINDAPLSFTAEETGSDQWDPRNFGDSYDGPVRMREALARSKNLVSIRILQAIDVQYAQDYVTRFGFDPKQHPAYLAMALGAGSVTPMQMAVGYAVFANGGFLISPYLIQRVEDVNGNIVEQSNPPLAGENAKQIIDPRNAFLMSSMMRDVVQRGTATRAKQLGRNDLAGKTGTTSNYVDAWFCGYQPDLVAIAWIGFDNPKSLGDNETGGRAALPIWMNYMDKALKGVPVASYSPPRGITTARINPETGLRGNGATLEEYFMEEQLPPEEEDPIDITIRSVEDIINDFLSN
ncbi:penicillin-binding protein 1A [Nitrosospira multiformis]|uniref:Penicillin-binding protein 1A n=1 Tax=Nitrosospira multiformis TaxID=1231 RepID=A0A1H8FC01_9PROT|nr:penicillin-binding protein 1A [Nitrosospira multiformis]SEN28568.1 penicillin-binding protein 1A [Nitrosospira multiformis]